MNPRTTILIAAALFALAAGTASFAPFVVAEVQPPPLPGQLQVVNSMTPRAGGGCDGGVTLHYAAKSTDTAVAFRAIHHDNCTATIEVAELETPVSYLGGATASGSAILWSGVTNGLRDYVHANMSAVWTGVNANAPCPSALTWSAWESTTLATDDYMIGPFAPDAPAWQNITGHDGLSSTCLTTSSTIWRDHHFSWGEPHPCSRLGSRWAPPEA